DTTRLLTSPVHTRLNDPEGISLRPSERANVRFGSLTDIASSFADVCSTPNSGHTQRRNQCPLSAKSRHRGSRWSTRFAVDNADQKCGVANHTVPVRATS